MGYDPVKLAERVREEVTRGLERLYWRFRYTRFYGGCSTADVVGCNLRCAFCWALPSRIIPKDSRYYKPEDVVRELVIRAKTHYLRISGGEPTIAQEHLIEVLKRVPKGYIFILETNGILIGYDKEFACELARFKNVFFRVSIKAANAEWFRKVTGASYGFELQLKALENLLECGVRPGMVRAAVVLGYGSKGEYAKLLRRLSEIHPSLADVEWEIIKLYPKVEERLRRSGLYPWIFERVGS